MTPIARWRAGLPDELAFWRRAMETRGLEWPEDFAQRLDPDRPLQTHLEILLPVAGDVRILDVGAGPFTIVGKRLGDRRVIITAIDPLAHAYDIERARFGLEGPVATLLGAGEDVLAMFGRDAFELAHARNSLDHAYDPVAAIEGMLAVAPTVYLEHSTREATKQRHEGLHQWDFYEEGGHFVVEGVGGSTVDVTERLAGRATVSTTTHGGWVVAILRRDAARGSPPAPPRGPSSP